MKYITLALLLAYTFGGQLWVAPVLAWVTVFFASLFYWLCFSLIVGTKKTDLYTEFHVADIATLRVIQIALVVFLWVTGYGYHAMFTLPWTIIMTMTDILTILVKWEIIEYTNRDEE
jgi:hypothetical protein